MREVLAIAPCPWCKKTPKFIMYLSDRTWLPKLTCVNDKCLVQPCSKSVPIRKKQKFNKEVIREKISLMISRWNIDNPLKAVEGCEFDWEEISHEESTRSGSLR